MPTLPWFQAAISTRLSGNGVYIHGEYYSTIKKNEILSFAAT
jgi:hypothetical protein